MKPPNSLLVPVVLDIDYYLIFLDFIMMHGFADAQAGTYRWGDNAVSL